ncbi:hypothetical protein EXIGLDRAFT_8361 [Exidia glandulosa HHB12029]|uniref:Homeobox domain-containing protein n=1 Tax=Exidia glandulosa HHB12029 TaxID=1314781 RepID=A0A165QPW4_EXIGL|nr:hypothetical protein EXIGLDRAFT_8361 [Exidia glandulosa HHB12029]
MISLIVSDLGPEVTSQNVGSWFAKRAKREAGQPRMTRKTPEQLAILDESFARYAYPGNEELIRLIRTTLLSKRQIDAWFCHQRKKFPQLIEAREIQKYVSALEAAAALQPGEKPKGLNTHPLEKMWKEVEAERQQTLARPSHS